mmetsp:Transcript_15589/g.42303  ORF Transcript_15589/g.42303 Transcript_15589/m.42303 type:complete len:111 (+) Transcript_15589:34-366(+)
MFPCSVRESNLWYLEKYLSDPSRRLSLAGILGNDEPRHQFFVFANDISSLLDGELLTVFYRIWGSCGQRLHKLRNHDRVETIEIYVQKCGHSIDLILFPQGCWRLFGTAI